METGSYTPVICEFPKVHRGETLVPGLRNPLCNHPALPREDVTDIRDSLGRGRIFKVHVSGQKAGTGIGLAGLLFIRSYDWSRERHPE